MIDLKDIAEIFGIKPQLLAEILFPRNKFPLVAYKRLIKSGSAELKQKQISRLAFFLNNKPETLVSKVYKKDDPLLVVSHKDWYVKVYSQGYDYLLKCLSKTTFRRVQTVYPLGTDLGEFIKQINTLIHED